MKAEWKNIEKILPMVKRPGRYIGNEINSIRKNNKSIKVRFALAFPDVYELGISNTGLHILYHILNQKKWISAERVYSPWIDMEAKLRENKIPLFSLETKSFIKNFDILGITLQYELHYTNIINMLDLCHIPVWQKDRRENSPLIIAGGPCSFNPEPISEFLDCVVLGDGETAVIEIARVIKKAKNQKLSRRGTLKALSEIKGVYIPSFYEINSEEQNKKYLHPVNKKIPEAVNARIEPELFQNFYPTKPLVPLIKVPQDRYSIEIMRGCTNGCRFCNAGIIYRPVRERSVADIITSIRKIIKNTGYNEISLGSLSTLDHLNIYELLIELHDFLKGKNISLSFPSLRADSFTESIAKICLDFNQDRLTLAPEAGTQRLRDVINKNITNQQILKAIETAFKNGWSRVKLYFMIGLPTETDEDIRGIAELTQQAITLAKRFRKKTIHIAISPFSPKPWTPFQWEKWEGSDSLQKKIKYLQEKITHSKVKMTWEAANVSKLETILGRGERKLSRVIYDAWKAGAKFDSWTDQFDFNKWLTAFKNNNIKMDNYLSEKPTDTPLPWDHLKKGVTKTFLLTEKDKASSLSKTIDCRKSICNKCGLMSNPICQEIISKKSSHTNKSIRKNIPLYQKKVENKQNSTVIPIRIAYSKNSELRFISHLETMRIFQLNFHRAKIDLAYSQGYHPRPKISSGPPLPLGLCSINEYLDVQLKNTCPADFNQQLNKFFAPGITILESKIIHKKSPSLTCIISLASYCVTFDYQINWSNLQRNISDTLKSNSLKVLRIKKGKKKTIDIRTFIDKLYIKNKALYIDLKYISQKTARIDEILHHIINDYHESKGLLKIKRTGLYIKTGDKLITPMEA
ncbi:MAG: TIGR03960 family B12-binding radical SAM protein [bacterium]